MSRIFVALLMLGVLPAVANAGLNPEMDEPYQYNIVVHFGKNRLLTPVFKQRVMNELRDWFEGALGDMAKVTVSDTHPLLPEIESRGLEQALDGQLQPLKEWRPVNAFKTHFVLIDYVDGQYQVQARQEDGFTGLASPVVRIDRTPDRSFVARTAARMLEHDFGPVATVQPGVSGSLTSGSRALDITITFKACNLGELKDRWVKNGDVFALARIFASQGRQASYRMPWVLVQAAEDPHNGRCRCRLFSRLQNPLAMSSTTYGYRCLKLGTITAPFRMRLMNDQNSGPLAFSVGVAISQQSFDAKPDEQLTPEEDGLVKTRKAYKNIAFVTVLNRETTKLALVPVDIVGDRIIACPISSDARAGIVAELNVRRGRLIRQLAEVRAISAQRFSEIAEQIKSDAKKEALAAAKSAAEALTKDINEAKMELITLREAVREAKMEQRLPLDDVQDIIAQLQQRVQELQEFCDKLTGVHAKETDPARARWAELVQKAAILEKTADYEEAIKDYGQVLQELPEDSKQPDLQKHYNELKRVWDLAATNPELAEARGYIYNVWPTLTTLAQLKENLPKVQQYFKVCQAARDYLTPRKLLVSFDQQAKLLGAREDKLTQSSGEDALTEAKTIGDLSRGLEELDKAIRAFIKATAPAG